jgi:hypothetical protein
MLGQRSSEETLRNSLDVGIPNESSEEQLRQELIETRKRLKEVESKLIKIKVDKERVYIIIIIIYVHHAST